MSLQGLSDPKWDHDACGVGAVADLKGRKTHDLVKAGKDILLNLSHRGACGCEETTGDGAGMLIQIPHKFFAREAGKLGFSLPASGYGLGMIFLPKDPVLARRCEKTLESVAAEEGHKVLGWRTPEVDNSGLGATALSGEPLVRQVFLDRGQAAGDDDFERRLYLIRKKTENTILAQGSEAEQVFYICSLSCRTLIYKGMFIAYQLFDYFKEIDDPLVESALCLVHSRFSTNVMPRWDLAHPFRYLCHNGEINTLRGNSNWMKAREALFESPLYPGEKMKELLPVVREGGSDSAVFDNVLEMLVMGGRTLSHSMMMMIPEAWQGHESMSRSKKDFYRYHASLMEPWDGPAHMAFTDGRYLGAVLDRNGLRPSRYYVTKDGWVVLASEVGVLDIPAEKVERKGRLQPGRMFLVDIEQGRIVDDEELKEGMASAQPYGRWLKEHLLPLDELPLSKEPPPAPAESLLRRQKMFGYTHEDLRLVVGPMAERKEEPIGSMGTDTPLAVLSRKPQLLFNYFKQLFAQVTNPPLDGIREELVTSLASTLGPEGNLLEPRPESCRQIEIKSPILSTADMDRLRHLSAAGFKSITLPMTFRVKEGVTGMEEALLDLCEGASRAVADGVEVLILSDRGAGRDRAPLPSLLACAAVHHHLIRKGERTRLGLVIDSGDPREVHHFCLLLGYGAGAVHPYLALESLQDLRTRGVQAAALSAEQAEAAYIKAANKGLLKTMSKMGISTVQSYRGAQIFEAIGLGRDLINRYFSWTVSRVEGIGLKEVTQEALARHADAFPDRPSRDLDLDWGGQYQWRKDGEFHMWNPETVHKLQAAVRTGSYKLFKEFSKLVDGIAVKNSTLRGLFEFRKGTPVPLAEVEPASEIVKRFATGAMSYGSISKEAHENLAIAMNRLGGKSNTGEGGEDEDRFERDANGDWRNSAIKQVASARFGVTSAYLSSARELQIKMAQGAKPGEGGQLPASKVYPWIAKTRHATPYVGLISPPPHHDIYSIEDLAQLIHDLKNSNPTARIAVKLVAEVGVGTVAAGVAKGKSDVVLVSGYDGGTGASPLSSIKHAGIPWELGLAETQQVLVREKLRDRIVVQTDGQLKTGRDVAIAALLGAEEFGLATGSLVASGCILMRVCHLDTCPVGVASQNPELRKKFAGKPEHVVNFMTFVAEELREIMAELGFRKLDEMVGRSDLLEVSRAVDFWKAKGLDLSVLLYRPENAGSTPLHKVREQDHGLEGALDHELIRLARPALEEGRAVEFSLPVRNTNRTVGTMLGHELTKRRREGLPQDSILIHLRGSAGQSFGAFLPRGVTLDLEGDGNDYVGKGLSGGRIIVRPPASSPFKAEDNIVIGNVALYGATSGDAYFRGLAGERFCVRNSGARAVVEGIGDHGCEYMTGGRVLVLGPTGRNFAAGMSGGVAYVLDEGGEFPSLCNMEMVGLEEVTEAGDLALIRELMENHVRLTGSSRARELLGDFDGFRRSLVKVMPRDYKRALSDMAAQQALAAGRGSH